MRNAWRLPPFAPAFLGAVAIVVLALGGVSVFVVGTTGASAAGTRPAAKQFHRGAAPHVTLLFVTSATSGSLQPEAGSATTYALTLQGLDRNVVWFTDHPARKAGTVPVTGFVEDWAGYGFKADPPNAALVLDSVHPGHDTAVGALSSLSFDPVSDRLQAEFTVYSGQRLKKVGGDLADKARRAAGATLPASFTGASLFIDDAWNPIINAQYFPQQVTTVVAQTLIGSPGYPLSFSANNYVFGLVQGSLADSTFSGPVTFSAPSLSEVNLSDVTEVGPTSIHFNVVDFTDADLQGADLPNASFYPGANFDGADLQGATLGQVPGAITDADTTCTNGLPGPCTGSNLTSG